MKPQKSLGEPREEWVPARRTGSTTVLLLTRSGRRVVVDPDACPRSECTPVYVVVPGVVLVLQRNPRSARG